MSEENPASKIQVDADWKAEAQAEKERLSAKEVEKAEEPTGPGGPQELPEADFKALMGLLASQAIMGLGAYTDPKTGGVVVDLVGSKFAIDLLGVLEEKTAGNVSDDEAKELAQVLAELRVRFVQVADAVAKQGEAGGVAPAAGTPPNVIVKP
jgi:hypothetical protein